MLDVPRLEADTERFSDAGVVSLRRETKMADDWVQQRFKKRKERLAEEAHKRRLNADVRASYDAMFQDLKDRIQKDVLVYNALFSSDDCVVDLRGNGREYWVHRKGDTLVTVTMSEGSVIQVRYGNSRLLSDESSFDRLEIATDPNDRIRFKHKNEFLSDVSEAAERILDRVLCK